ncbi:MAG: hypothetical protein FWF50_05980, partial [Defluviitaleaceae bacterium]|nr:hypothetical protein [Defluviitaleaceae bacterium]
MFKNKKFLKITAAISVAIAVSPLPNAIYAASTGLREQRDAAASEIQVYQASIQATEENIANAEREIQQLELALLAILNELSDLSKQVSETRATLEDTELALEQAILDREAMEALLLERLRAMYMNGPTTYLSFILGSGSFSEVLRRFEYINRIAEHDQNLVEQFLAIEDTIDNKRIILEEEYAVLIFLERQEEQRLAEHEATLIDLNARIDALDVERQTQVAGLNQMEQSYEYLTELIRREERAARVRQQATTTSNNRVVTQTTGRDGSIRWPVPARNNISSPFGPRRSPISGRQENHTGIDIPAPTGSDVIAAASGTV